eukprot:1694397-Amphidinium_carterae.1
MQLEGNRVEHKRGQLGYDGRWPQQMQKLQCGAIRGKIDLTLGDPVFTKQYPAHIPGPSIVTQANDQR